MFAQELVDSGGDANAAAASALRRLASGARSRREQ